MGAKASKLSDAEEARIARRCAARRSAFVGCRASNPDNAAACERLEAALAMCCAGELEALKSASAEHERCFTSVVNTGRYKGRLHCTPELDALKDGLKRHGLYPFPAPAAAR